MNTDLTGKRAVVCGASKGIGRACAEALSLLGAEITLLARNADELDRVRAHLRGGAKVRHTAVAVDLSDAAQIDRAADRVLEGGPVQILINNTGGPPAGQAVDAQPQQFASAFAAHVLAAQSLVRRFVPGMRQTGYGRIVNIISTSVVTPIAGLGVSNTVRGAMANWGRTLAFELAPDGITVNNVLPGYTSTERLGSIIEGRAAKQGSNTDAVAEAMRAGVPMRRFAEPAEIASVVAFLASPAASYVSGVNLPVDGARLAVQA